MNIKQVARLLNDINMSTTYTESTLEEVGKQGDSIYKLRRNNSRWEFVFIEGRLDRSTVQKTFDMESEACRYFYLHQLRTYFLYNYDVPFRLENRDINVGLPDFDLDNLKEALKKLKINDSYYSINGPIKPHSVHLETFNDSESIVRFIGRNGDIIIDAPPIENWSAYLNVYRTVYNLFLFDQHNKLLLDEQEIEEPFSDKDYKVVLS